MPKLKLKQGSRGGPAGDADECCVDSGGTGIGKIDVVVAKGWADDEFDVEIVVLLTDCSETFDGRDDDDDDDGGNVGGGKLRGYVEVDLGSFGLNVSGKVREFIICWSWVYWLRRWYSSRVELGKPANLMECMIDGWLKG